MTNELTTLSAEEQRIQELLATVDITNPRARQIAELAQNPSVPTLGGALNGLEASLRRQAALDILPSIADTDLTETQIRAVWYGQMLKHTKSLDFASFEILYGLLRTIAEERLAQVHPSDYTMIVGGEDRSFLRMAEEEAGISNSVASDVMMLGGMILPYIERTLDIPRYRVWERISTTNLRAMVPILRLMINQVEDTGDDRRPQQRILNRAEQVQMRWAADELDIEIEPDNETLAEMDEDQVQGYINMLTQNRERVRHWLTQQRPERRVAGTVAWMLDHAENETTDRFARLIGTREDDPFDMYVHRRNRQYYVTAALTQDQYDTLMRTLRNRANPHEVDSLEALLQELGRPHATE